MEKNLDRTLVDGPLGQRPATVKEGYLVRPKIFLGPEVDAAIVEMETRSSGPLWLQSLSLRNPDRDAAEASGIIDTLLVFYADNRLGVFEVRNAWFKEAIHCTQFLIKQGKSEEAVSFVKRERERAQGYNSDRDLGPTATAIQIHLCRLLRDANLPGCD